LDALAGYELWQFTTGNNVFSSPAVANGMLFVGSEDNNVYAFSLPNNPVRAPERPDPATLRPNPNLKQ